MSVMFSLVRNLLLPFFRTGGEAHPVHNQHDSCPICPLKVNGNRLFRFLLNVPFTYLQSTSHMYLTL